MSQEQEIALLLEDARNHLAGYLPLVHTTNAGRPAIPPIHLRNYVIPAIEDDSLGHTVVILPPGAAKTTALIAACGWWLGRDPTQHIAYICNDTPAAVERSTALQRIIESPHYRAIFPHVQPDKALSWSQTKWYLRRPNLSDKDATFGSYGIMSGIVGVRLDRAIMDDLADTENMKTEGQRKQVQTIIAQDVLTRFQGSPIGRAVMLTTRWHEDDPAGWAIKQGWHVVKIPALDIEGNSYWPEERPAAGIRCAGDHDPDRPCCMWKQLGGERPFQLVMQGVVVSDTMSLFKRQNWREYEVVPHEAQRGGIFVDLAHTTKKTSDATAISVVATDGVKRYWKDVYEERAEFPEIMRLVKTLRERYQFPIIIEDSPGSKALIQTLQRELWGVIPYPTGGRDKWARAEAVADAHETGNWLLPKEAWWKTRLIEQYANFHPNASEDDLVDTGTMMESYFRTRGQQSPNRKNRKPFKRAWDLINERESAKRRRSVYNQRV